MSEHTIAHGGPRHRAAEWLASRARARPAARRRLGLRFGVALLLLIVLASLLQPVLGLPAPNFQNYGAVLVPPGPGHLFGTDNVGRDVLSRTLAAGRLDLVVVAAVTGASCILGLLIGAIAGFLGGTVESIVMRIVDVLIAVPFYVLVITVIAIVGPGVKPVLICVPAVGWVTYARLTRAEMLVLREQEFILAAQTMGFSRRRTLFIHALPNAWRPAVVFSAIDAVSNIILFASLSFLGVGVQEPTAEWGRIIASGQVDFPSAWWISLIPAAVVIAVGISLALIADGLSDQFEKEVPLAA